jgi:hypothetical protein
MSEPVDRDARNPRQEGERSTVKLSSERQPVPSGGSERLEIALTESGGAMVAAILHLVRLMGAELVLLRGCNVAQLEQAVRAKLPEFTSPTPNKQAREAGLAQASHLVEQVLVQIRAQAELKKSLTVADRGSPASAAFSPLPPSLLN